MKKAVQLYRDKMSTKKYSQTIDIVETTNDPSIIGKNGTNSTKRLGNITSQQLVSAFLPLSAIFHRRGSGEIEDG
jgi:hypothetical protein